MKIYEVYYDKDEPYEDNRISYGFYLYREDAVKVVNRQYSKLIKDEYYTQEIGIQEYDVIDRKLIKGNK